ncbi:MAG: hypothetical protein J5972_00980, partial [Eubacterium sp.]|nr:hypothetical protein [Eubacterium sp.]
TKGEGRDAFASVEMKLCGEIVSRTHDMISHIVLKGEEYGGQWEVMINQLLRYGETRQRFGEQIQEVYQQFHISLGFSFLLCVVSGVMVPRGMLENMMLVPMYVVSLTLVVVGFFMSVIWMYRKILSSRHRQRCNLDSSMSRKKDFAEWIDDVLMRLPKMSTYQALQTSKRVADWMEPFVDKFVDDIYNEPTSICPYLNFAKKIQVEESEKILCLLYAIQREDKERFASQLRELEACQMTMKEQIEENRRQKEIMYFSRGRQIPLFLAGFKIVLDLVGYVYLMLQQPALG